MTVCKLLKILFTNFMIEHMLLATIGITEKSSIIVLDYILLDLRGLSAKRNNNLIDIWIQLRVIQLS